MGKLWRKKQLRLTTDSGVLMDGLDLGRALVHFPAVSLLTLLPFIEIGTVRCFTIERRPRDIAGPTFPRVEFAFTLH